MFDLVGRVAGLSQITGAIAESDKTREETTTTSLI